MEKKIRSWELCNRVITGIKGDCSAVGTPLLLHTLVSGYSPFLTFSQILSHPYTSTAICFLPVFLLFLLSHPLKIETDPKSGKRTFWSEEISPCRRAVSFHIVQERMKMAGSLSCWPGHRSLPNVMPLQLSPVSTEHALDMRLCDSLPHPASAMWNQLTSAASFMFSSFICPHWSTWRLQLLSQAWREKAMIIRSVFYITLHMIKRS